LKETCNLHHKVDEHGEVKTETAGFSAVVTFTALEISTPES
jgi:hypothetical protein